MSAPLLRAIPSPAATSRHLPPLASSEEVQSFLVVGEGEYRGVSFAVGDVVLCRGEVRPGTTTVLVASRGRPRLGAVEGLRLVGDAGEPCHPGRWQAAGALWRVYARAADGGWTFRRLAGEEAAAQRPARVQRTRTVTPKAQLALFAA